MTERVYNFSPGPAMLPEAVLRHAQEELLALPAIGMSVLEISHRSEAFDEILATAEARLRGLLSIPDDYHVLFLQGGSRLQFSMVPMNVLGGRTADYVVTGSWGKKAVEEAGREGAINVAWDGGESNYDRLPSAEQLQLTDEAAFVHFTSNETIQGVQFRAEPETGDVPLICDASSDFLSRPIDVSRHSLLYACAQKNAGPAGVTVVIICKDAVEACPSNLPGMLNYRNHVEAKSCYNTPPVFGVYLVNLVAQWLLDQGGLAAIEQRNEQKAAQLYSVIDASDGFYGGHAQPDCRSLMNVTFRLPNEDLQTAFLAAAQQHQLYELKGHRSVGGIRASIYNAMPVAGVKALAEFMDDFANRHG
ncbi:MAG: 3-phosphoserine/phosphohydroxythreonine transaminase [Pirellulales bacterium]